MQLRHPYVRHASLCLERIVLIPYRFVMNSSEQYPDKIINSSSLIPCVMNTMYIAKATFAFIVFKCRVREPL